MVIGRPYLSARFSPHAILPCPGFGFTQDVIVTCAQDMVGEIGEVDKVKLKALCCFCGNSCFVWVACWRVVAGVLWLGGVIDSGSVALVGGMGGVRVELVVKWT